MAQPLEEGFSHSAISGNVFVRTGDIKKEGRKVESTQARAGFAYFFPLQNIKGSLNVITLEMLPFPLPFNLNIMYDSVLSL